MGLRLIFFVIICSCVIEQSLPGEWKRVALTSYPRSGNHWMRYLVEEASHIATSSVYPDSEPPKHLKKRFPWGGFITQNGYEGNCRHPKEHEVVLLKTHYPVHQARFGDKLTSIGAIRLVRHPVDSFYSQYIYNKKKRGKETEDIVPSDSVRWYIQKWKKYQEHWNSAQNVVTFRYEDLFSHLNLKSALSTVFKIMQYDISDDDIERACNKFPAQGNPLKHIDKFKKEDLKLIATELKDLMIMFDYSIPLEYL